MPLKPVEYKKLKGLFLMRNSFEVPDGAMEEALNVVIANDDLITSRRGFYQYFDIVSGTANNLFNFINTLFCVYNNKIAYYRNTGSSPNETGSQTILGGTAVSVTGDRVSRNVKQSGNMYFTTDSGVLKVEGVADVPPEYDILISGAPPGLDLDVFCYNLNITDPGNESPVGAGKIAGYRVVFGYTDANKNLILGAPSSIKTISYPVLQGTYTSSGSMTTWTVTVTTADPHALVYGVSVVFSAATDTDLEGDYYQIAVTSETTFTFEFEGANPGSGTVTFNVVSPPTFQFSLPAEIIAAPSTQPWFFRLYRSSQQDISVGIFSDFRVSYQAFVTADQKALGYVFQDPIFDYIGETFLGAELYTNENSGEGEGQANFMPPLTDDLAVFKDIGIFAGITQRATLSLNTISTVGMGVGDFLTFTTDAAGIDYYGYVGIGNKTTVVLTSDNAGAMQFNYVDHGFNDGFLLNIVWSGLNLDNGTPVYVVNSAPNTFEVSLTQGGASFPYDGSVLVMLEGVRDDLDKPMYQIATGTSEAANIRDLAEGIVKALNRNADSTIYAQYASTPSESPGRMTFISRDFVAEPGIQVTGTANDIDFRTTFIPPVPILITDNPPTSGAFIFPNGACLSKQGIFEAVPLLNFISIGAKSAAILGVRALRDSTIFLKEDGVYRMTGDTVAGLSVTILDSTIICVAPRSIKVLNNEVYFLSNQGVCKVSDNAVGIISREGIEDLIQPILGQTNLSSQTSGVAYETDRTYQLTTTTPNDDTATACYTYNILTGQWTESDKLFKEAIVGPDNILFQIDIAGDILRERKTQTRYDYSDQNYDVLITDITGVTLTVTMLAVPEKGDMIVKDEVITRIVSDPEALDPVTYTFDVSDANNLIVGDNVILYGRIVRRIKWSPFTCGSVSAMKLFNQMIIELRDDNLSACKIYFSGYQYGGSQEIDWVSRFGQGGWGELPWGLFPWGEQDGIDLTQGTQPSSPIRVYIPQFQARTTFLQPILEHIQAGEATNIQSISFLVRVYNERPSR